MDTQAVAEAAGVGVGTLNVWIQRRLIPGVTVGPRGRVPQPRDFDLDTAIHIAVMAQLMRTGITAPTASETFKNCSPGKPWLLLLFDWTPTPAVEIYDPSALAILQKHIQRAPAAFPFDSEGDLPKLFEHYQITPAAYTVVNIELIKNRVREVHDRWERERAGRWRCR